MSEGWIALHRGWRDSPIFRGEYSRADAWVWLIENAAWKPSRARIKGDTVELARGELSFSQRFLAEKWGWSKSRVDRFIAELREESMIETRSKIGATAGHAAGQGQGIISICNYDKYQSLSESERGNDDDKIGATAGQQRGKEEQGNKGTIRKGAKAPKERGRSFVDWPELPIWIPEQPWQAFLEMRWKKGAWPTAHAVTLLVADLEGWRAKGHDPGLILNNSTKSNWTGLFEPRNEQNGQQQNRNAAPLDRRDGIARALDRQLGFDEAPEPPRRSDIGGSAGDSARPVARLAVLR